MSSSSLPDPPVTASQGVVAGERWPMIFTVLSMDVTAAFFDLMGLTVRDPRCLVAELRAAIVDVRRLYRAQGAEARFDPEEVLARISRRCGADVAARVRWWATHVHELAPRDRLELLVWTDVLRHCRKQPGLWARLGLPGALAQAARERLNAALRMDAYEQRALVVFDAPLSDWDLHMYAVNLFDDEDDVLANGPDRYIYPAVANFAMYTFWAWLLPQLTPDAERAFLENANQIVREEPELAYVGPLPRPRIFDVGA